MTFLVVIGIIGFFVFLSWDGENDKRIEAKKAVEAAERADKETRLAEDEAKRKAMRDSLDHLSQKIPTSSTSHIAGRRIKRQIQVVSVTSEKGRRSGLSDQDFARCEFLQAAERIGADGVVNLKIVSHRHEIVTQGDAVVLD